MTRMLTLSLSTLALLAAPAAAEQLTVRGSRAVDEAVIRVSYGDLQLADASDADALRTRVHRATRRGCAELYGSTQPSQEWACRDIAADAAAPQVKRAISAAQAGLALKTTSVVVRLASR